MKFEEYLWHNSEIKNIEIDRTNPGKSDTVLFEISVENKGPLKLIFEDVYWVSLNMNLGVEAPEYIDYAFIEVESVDVLDLYKRWNGLIEEIELHCYVIKTISTSSLMKIIAKNFTVV
ncbi:hypothetical protein EA772_01175 [Pedobacter sp. G11]|uniref:hypothetical protein n=1 Tax=Pedobacter sp. G11 TaxID=2482728 RepID=UPI000F5F2508|nr:hypothetical protein [Pedobacter sp. G11]AZI24020.1 hypothetical protein EA772_01175 [Pedobacter sp. G11]